MANTIPEFWGITKILQQNFKINGPLYHLPHIQACSLLERSHSTTLLPVYTDWILDFDIIDRHDLTDANQVSYIKVPLMFARIGICINVSSWKGRFESQNRFTEASQQLFHVHVAR